MLLMHIVTGIISLYVIIRLIFPLSVSWEFKLILAILILLVAQYHFFNRYFFGGMASPDLPYPVLLFCGWLFVAFILLFLLLLIKDCFALFFWLLRLLKLPATMPFSALQWSVGLTGLALLLSGYGVWQAVRIPDVNALELFLPDLPATLDGFNLVQISDLHASSLFQEPRTRKIVNKVNLLQPDIVLLTGDIVDGLPEQREKDMAPLKDLKTRYGVFACLGNHEYFSDFYGWLREFKDLGLEVLKNDHVVLKVKGETLIIAGITDPVAPMFEEPGPDVMAAFKGAPEIGVRILMAHQPKEAKANAAAKVDLQLSGHTHGGQIKGIHWISGKFFNGGYVSGLYRIGRMFLYVSNGAGLWSGLPVRLGVPAEISQIILRSPNLVIENEPIAGRHLY